MDFPSPLKLLNPLPTWVKRRKWPLDVFLMLALILITAAVVLSLTDEYPLDERPATLLGWAIMFGPAFAIPIRRILPTTAVISGGFLQAVMWVSKFPDFYLSTALLLYSAAAHGGRRGRRASWFTTVALTSFAGIGVVDGDAPTYVLPIVGMFSVAASALGSSVANRVAYTDAVEARTLDVQRSQQAEQDRALTEERNRIARELHDVVAHGLSVIVVQAAAAQRVLDRDPEGARSALQQIEKTGRTSLTEMRHVLSLVRTDPEESWRPALGLSNLDELIAELRKTGLDVSVTTEGNEPSSDNLPATVDMTAYRIVQESLTNVLKHGGQGAAATVEISHKADSLDVSVFDNGRGSAAAESGGHGLRGMQERVEVFGGEFWAGPRLSGGFEVKVSLPLDGVRTT